MVQCEMCGADVANPTTVKIEGAELQVCESCAAFGTEVTTADASSTTTKYSTTSSSGTSPSTGQAAQSSSSGQQTGRPPSDLFDQMEELASDYPERIREARESFELSQEDLASELNEKASLIRKLERGDMQPNDAIQQKLERRLDISLTEGGETDETEWESDITPDSMTLGDVVRRRD